jgi:hypothetical protein
MRTRGISKKSNEKYLDVLIQLHQEITFNPKCNTQQILRKCKISNNVTSVLRRMNVLDKDDKNNWVWLGKYPNMEMVYELKKILQRIQKKYNRIKPIQPEMIFESTNETKKIHKPLTAEDVKDRKQLITYCKTPKKQPESRKFELSLLGFKIFTLIY